jgi:hypothetical protein
MSVDNDQDKNDNVITLPKARSEKGEFFMFDRRLFSEACKLGLNAGIAYLLIARGAGCRPTARWSVNALEHYTGMGRPRAKAAIAKIVGHGLLNLEKSGKRPVYGIPTFDSWISARLSDDEKRVLGLFSDGLPTKINRRDELIARRLCGLGFLKDHGGRYFSKVDLGESQKIWLPNAIVDGAAEEVPPVALLRQMQDVRRLQLFVALYDANRLTMDGGVSREFLYETHEVSKVSERGERTIWGFQEASERTATAAPLPSPFLTGKRDEKGKDHGWPEFWKALRVFQDCGLLTFIPHVFDSAGPDAEVVHAYPLDDAGCEPWERAVAEAAHAAGVMCIPASQAEWASQQGRHLLPLPSHLDSVTVIGIARLRYRPKTRMTAAWFAISKERCEEKERDYRELAEANKSAGSSDRRSNES